MQARQVSGGGASAQAGERRIWADYLALLALLVAATVNNWLWITSDATPLRGDHAQHLVASLKSHDQLRAGDLLAWLFTSVDAYPPLACTVSSLLHAVLGRSPEVARISQTLFLGLLLLSVYALGRQAFDRRAGLAAAFFAGTCPLSAYFSHEFFLDLPLGALVALSLYLLLRAWRSADWRYWAAFGLATGLASITKWTFAFYLCGALLWLALVALGRLRWRIVLAVAVAASGAVLYLVKDQLLAAVLESGGGPPPLEPPLSAALGGAVAVAAALVVTSVLLRRRLPPLARNLMLAAAGFALVALPYYLLNLREAVSHMAHSARSMRYTPLIPGSLDDLRQTVQYFGGFVHAELLALPYTVLLLLGLGVYLARRRWSLELNALLAAAVFALVTLYLVPDNKARYLLPLMGPLAVAATWWIFQLGRLRYVALAALLALGLYQAAGWAVVPRPPVAHGPDKIANRHGMAPAPKRADCRLGQVIEQLVRASGERPFSLAVLIRGEMFADYVGTYQLHLLMHGLEFRRQRRHLDIPGASPTIPGTIRRYFGFKLEPQRPTAGPQFLIRAGPAADLAERLSPEERGLLKGYGLPSTRRRLASCLIRGDSYHVLYQLARSPIPDPRSPQPW